MASGLATGDGHLPGSRITGSARDRSQAEEIPLHFPELGHERSAQRVHSSHNRQHFHKCAESSQKPLKKIASLCLRRFGPVLDLS